MQKEQQHINHLLRRWISGEITAREELELEAAAKEDEFVREALAGYRSHSAADHASRLTHLRQRLKPVQKPVRQLKSWMRIAAAVALLLVAGWVVFQTQSISEGALATNQAEAPAEVVEDKSVASESEETFKAKIERGTPPLEEIAASAEEPVETGDFSSVPTTPDISQSDTELIAAAKKRAEAEADANIGASETATGSLLANDPSALQGIGLNDEAEKSIALESVSVEKDEVVTTAPPPTPTATTPDVYRTQTQAPPPTRLEDRSATSNSGVRVPNAGYRVINGYVTDEDGNPLIGASILEAGSTNGTVADIDGYYELTVSNESETLLVSYTGFEATTVSIDETTEISVVLNENQLALDEVVVTDLSSGYNKEYVEEDEVIGNARPEGGFSDLRRYIKDNVAENAGRANVKIRFYVQADGRPTNISIVSSTNPSLNTEAIRLIDEGPNWEITSGEAPVEILYTVKFR